MPYNQNVPILGRLLAEWDDRPAGALFLLPLWHPVLLAEQIGTLAAIARGPFVLQCAVGGGDEQFRVFGTTLRERAEAVRGCARHHPRAVPGRVGHRDRRPLDRRAGPDRAGSAGAARGLDRRRLSPAIDRAARMGDAFLIGPEATPAEVTALVQSYRDACARHGREATRIAVRRDVHVAATDEEAAAVAGPVVERGYRGFDPAAVVFGGPERVADAFSSLRAVGCTDVIIRHLADDQGAVLRSFEQLATVRERLL